MGRHRGPGKEGIELGIGVGGRESVFMDKSRIRGAQAPGMNEPSEWRSRFQAQGPR